MEVEKTFSGFIVKSVATSVAIDGGKLQERIEALHGELLIGKLVGPKPFPIAFQAWLRSLHQDMRAEYSHL